MSTLFYVLVAVYRLFVASWNACSVFLQVMRSVMQEAKQEAAELMALPDGGAPMTVSPHRPSSTSADQLLPTGRGHVDVVATLCRWT